MGKIRREGFDDRLNDPKRMLYGHGLYFSTESCKCAQYCGHGDIGYFILARVVLGHPYMATGPMKTHGRPPMVDGYGVPHDSTIAQPGIVNNQSGDTQVHWE